MKSILEKIDQAAKDWNRELRKTNEDWNHSKEEKYKKEWYRLIKLYNEIRNHSSTSK